MSLKAILADPMRKVGACGRVNDVPHHHVEQRDPVTASGMDVRARDYRHIDMIDQRVYDDVLDCWVYCRTY